MRKILLCSRRPKRFCRISTRSHLKRHVRFDRFLKFHKCRNEVAGAVILAKDYVGMDVFVQLCDTRLTNGRHIRLFGRKDTFYALLCSSLFTFFSADQKHVVEFFSIE